jgi:hypothetical protein
MGESRSRVKPPTVADGFVALPCLVTGALLWTIRWLWPLRALSAGSVAGSAHRSSSSLDLILIAYVLGGMEGVIPPIFLFEWNAEVLERYALGYPPYNPHTPMRLPDSLRDPSETLCTTTAILFPIPHEVDGEELRV